MKLASPTEFPKLTMLHNSTDLVESEEGLHSLSSCSSLGLQQVSQLVHGPQLCQQVAPLGRQENQLPWRLGMLRHNDGWAGIMTVRGAVFWVECLRYRPRSSLQR